MTFLKRNLGREGRENMFSRRPLKIIELLQICKCSRFNHHYQMPTSAVEGIARAVTVLAPDKGDLDVTSAGTHFPEVERGHVRPLLEGVADRITAKANCL